MTAVAATEARDRIVLGRIETAARLLGRASDSGPVERRIDEVARNALPAALAEALARRLGAGDAVIRIAAIELDLTVPRDVLDSGEFAGRWAARLGETIAARLRGPDAPGLARFASHGELAAAYVEHRFAVAPHPAFAFAEFDALSHVTPAAAAIELLGARAAFLPALARLGARRGQPAWLAERLGTADAAALLDRLFAHDNAAVAEEAGADTVDAMLAAAPAAWRGLDPPRAALALALARFAAAGAPPDDPVGTIALARILAAIAALAGHAPDFVAGVVTGAPVAAADLAALPPAVGRELAFTLPLATSVGGRRLLDLAATALRGRSAPTDAAAKPGAPRRRTAPDPARLASPFAGSVLLLPALVSLRPALPLTPGQLRALLIAAVAPAPELEPAAAALADFLVPEPDRAPASAWPPLPAGIDDPPSAETHAARLLAAFAARLPGLEASSAHYLRRQFLHIRGTLTLTDKLLDARIARPPLAIVLTMAGLVGDRGALPWLGDRRLRIGLE